MSSKTLIAPLAALLLCACNFSGGKDNAVPRPHAYPRVEAYDSTRRGVALRDISITVPAQSITDSISERSLTLSYPLYGARLYLSTVSTHSAEELKQHLANRRQRISLNLSGRQMQESTFKHESLDCSVIRSLESTTIPVQLLATDGHGTLLSAAFVLNGATEPLDSVRPIVDLLEKEGIAILQSIK